MTRSWGTVIAGLDHCPCSGLSWRLVRCVFPLMGSQLPASKMWLTWHCTKWCMCAIVPLGLSPERRCLWAFLYHPFFSWATSVVKCVRRPQLTVNFGCMCLVWLHSLRVSNVPYWEKQKILGGTCCLWEQTWAGWSEMNSIPIPPALSPWASLWRSG